MRLLGLRWTGAGGDDIGRAVSALLATQQTDGGFAQLDGDPCDAYATATALVALQQAGDLDPEHPAYRRGVAWLLAHQHSDGSWHVPTRRRGEGLAPFDSGFPHGDDQFISCASTAWAVMALAATIDPRPSMVFHGPRPPRGERARTLSPLLEAASFGSFAELERAIGTGPVDAPGPGSITALGLAVHDERKVAALLTAGARVEVRSELGMTPLALAALAGTTATVRRLLAAGADANATAKDADFRSEVGQFDPHWGGRCSSMTCRPAPKPTW